MQHDKGKEVKESVLDGKKHCKRKSKSLIQHSSQDKTELTQEISKEKSELVAKTGSVCINTKAYVKITDIRDVSQLFKPLSVSTVVADANKQSEYSRKGNVHFKQDDRKESTAAVEGGKYYVRTSKELADKIIRDSKGIKIRGIMTQRQVQFEKDRLMKVGKTSCSDIRTILKEKHDGSDEKALQLSHQSMDSSSKSGSPQLSTAGVKTCPNNSAVNGNVTLNKKVQSTTYSKSPNISPESSAINPINVSYASEDTQNIKSVKYIHTSATHSNSNTNTAGTVNIIHTTPTTNPLPTTHTAPPVHIQSTTQTATMHTMKQMSHTQPVTHPIPIPTMQSNITNNKQVKSPTVQQIPMQFTADDIEIKQEPLSPVMDDVNDSQTAETTNNKLVKQLQNMRALSCQQKILKSKSTGSHSHSGLLKHQPLWDFGLLSHTQIGKTLDTDIVQVPKTLSVNNEQDGTLRPQKSFNIPTEKVTTNSSMSMQQGKSQSQNKQSLEPMHLNPSYSKATAMQYHTKNLYSGMPKSPHHSNLSQHYVVQKNISSIKLAHSQVNKNTSSVVGSEQQGNDKSERLTQGHDLCVKAIRSISSPKYPMCDKSSGSASPAAYGIYGKNSDDLLLSAKASQGRIVIGADGVKRSRVRKQLKNKGFTFKPDTITKGTMCRPMARSRGTMTGKSFLFSVVQKVRHLTDCKLKTASCYIYIYIC